MLEEHGSNNDVGSVGIIVVKPPFGFGQTLSKGKGKPLGAFLHMFWV